MCNWYIAYKEKWMKADAQKAAIAFCSGHTVRLAKPWEIPNELTVPRIVYIGGTFHELW